MEQDGSNTAAPDVQAMAELFFAQTEDYAFAFLDCRGHILAWRGAATRILGYSEAEVLGRAIELIFTSQDRSLGLPELERHVAAVDGHAYDDRWHLRKDGTHIWLTGSVVPLRDTEGQPVGFVKVMRDRTDLRTQLETLENRVDHLSSTHHDKDVFFARLTHEVRNSLGPMRNAATLIQRAPGPDQITFALAIFERQLDFLTRMVSDLSELARVGVGKLDLMRQRIDLGCELQRLLDGLKPRALQKRQDLQVLLPAASIEVDADRERLHQIVFNLLDNAIKYTPEGGRIWLKLTVEGRHAVVRVRDDGVGIAPEVLPRIFDLFTQEVPSGAAGGFGVGLSLVKELVDAHQGTVEVRSDGKGLGSEFTVRLPVAGVSPRRE